MGEGVARNEHDRGLQVAAGAGGRQLRTIAAVASAAKDDPVALEADVLRAHPR